MPEFIYRAKNGPGKTVEGELVADTHAGAVARIDAMGYIPIWVREKQAGMPSGRLSLNVRVRSRDVDIFTRQLSSLLKSGVPILRCLATIRDQTENRKLKAVIADLERSVRDGRMLSEAIVRYPFVFPP